MGKGRATRNTNTVLMEKQFGTHSFGRLYRRCGASTKTHLGILSKMFVGMGSVWYWLIIVSSGGYWH